MCRYIFHVLLVVTTFASLVIGDTNLSTSSILNVTINPREKTIFTDELYFFRFEIQHNYNRTDNITLLTSLTYAKVGEVLKCEITEYSDFNMTGLCELKALRLGETFVILKVVDSQNVEEFKEATFHLIVLRVMGAKDTAYRVVITIIVVVATFSMGCGLDIDIMLTYLKKPFAPAVGFISQFIFMPLIAFGLAEATGLEKSFGFGLLTIGCSPGGGGSNLWTALLGGDLNLSMTMTFISTVAAFGMMPLWLFILGRFFIDTENIKIPFEMIFLNLIQIIIPIIAGLLFKWRKPKLAMKVHRVIKIFGVIFLIFIFTVGTWVNLYMYELLGDYPTLLPIGAALPWIGFLFGFLFALLLRQSKKKAITIALETGIQNIGVPILILTFAFPKPQGSLAAIIPVIVAIFTPIPLTLILIALTIYRKFFQKESSSSVGNVEQYITNIKEDDEKDNEKGASNDGYAISLTDMSSIQTESKLAVN